MRRTSAALLFALVVVGGVVGWLLQVGLAAGGSPIFLPPLTSYAVLFVIAVLVLLLGWPVRRSVHGDRAGRARAGHRPVDPFYAMRVLMLAKASSITGGLGLGFGLALTAYAVSRVAGIATPAFWPCALLAIGALVLMVAGLIAESWCRIPPEDQADLARRGVEAR